MANRGQVEVTTRLVRLRLKREAKVIALILHIGTQEVDRLPEPFDRVTGVAVGIRLRALAPAPEDVGRRAQLRAEIDGPHRLLQGEGAYSRVRGGKGAILEYWVREEVGRRHRHDHPGVNKRLLEAADDAIAFLKRGVKRDQ